jgi:hypothetical protein
VALERLDFAQTLTGLRPIARDEAPGAAKSRERLQGRPATPVRIVTQALDA